MEGNHEARPNPTPAPAAAAKTSWVLGNDDLLREILLRLDFPTCLARASLVSKRWLRHASDPAFIRRFRDRCPPRLLGFYVQDLSRRHPLFVSVLEAPELATEIRRASVAAHNFIIRGSRNGRLLVRGMDATAYQHQVLSPLHLTRGVTLLPPPPRPTFSRFFLPVDGGDDGVVALEVRHGRHVQAQVLTLQSGVWAFRAIAGTELPYGLSAIGDILPPVHGKMYMGTAFDYILGLDLAAASFFILRLPDRVKTANFRLSCGEDSGLFLIHAEGHLLSVWHHKTDSNDADDWVLVDDAILVREAINRMENVLVVGVDNNAEFVLLGLERSGVLICMHLTSRIEKVHHERFSDMGLLIIFPFMMTCPPFFPALREENNQDE